MVEDNVRLAQNKPDRERGQSLIIMAFAFVALLLIVGLAIDLGMVYIERIRLSRACDAAALAAASELPFEAEAHSRAIEALAHNDYDVTIALVRINDAYWGGPADARVTIDINTVDYQNKSLPVDQQPDTADRIRVEGRSLVRMNIMQLVGIREAPVNWRAVAENVNNLDITLVLDRSGSMQEDTICFGCYDPAGSVYPSGERYPLAYPEGVNDPCSESDPIESGGDLYLVMEAEYYDATSADYHREYNDLGDSYWALQRPGGDTGNCGGNQTCGSSSLDNRGAYMMHMPHSSVANVYTFAQAATDAPRMDYQVQIPAAYHNDRFYVYVRGQGGNQWGEQPVSSRLMYWGMDGSPIGQTSTGNFSAGGYAEPVIGAGSWTWGRMSNDVVLSQGTHTLNIWAGGIGFRLDKIILTTNGLYSPSGDGPDETHGRDPNGYACSECNPNYGLLVGDGTPPDGCDNRRDDLYDDDQPIRFLKEASKDFVARLDPAVDQIGVVRYSTTAGIGKYLQCVVRLGDACTDFNQTASDVRVLDYIESLNADGGTNIPDGMRRAIEVFSHTYARGAAAHIMILMTDGQTNQIQGLDAACYADDLWEPPSSSNDQDRSRDCVVYFTNQAKELGYVVYSISLGAQADIELLEFVAAETGGQHYNAPRAEDLSAIFQAIADHIFLRLIE
ncbi:MAG: pilus assembly protein TadG-related protein [Chloroflexota bacterium]